MVGGSGRLAKGIDYRIRLLWRSHGYSEAITKAFVTKHANENTLGRQPLVQIRSASSLEITQDVISHGRPGIDSVQGWEENKNWWRVVDRKEAIAKALEIAKKNDVILLLGKGSEQKMAVKRGKMIPWNDTRVVQELLGG